MRAILLYEYLASAGSEADVLDMGSAIECGLQHTKAGLISDLAAAAGVMRALGQAIAVTGRIRPLLISIAEYMPVPLSEKTVDR